MANRIAIFPGSFDPFTKGHEDIVLRGAKMFDKVIIAIGVNTSKKRHFDIELMISKIEEVFATHTNVEVTSFSELTADFAKSCGANYILRGLRNTIDFEYENSISHANKHLNGELETVFLVTDPQLAHISSSITREIQKMGGDISGFIPYKLS